MCPDATWSSGSLTLIFLLQYDSCLFFTFAGAFMASVRLFDTPKCSNGVEECDEQTLHVSEKHLHVSISYAALLSGEC